MEYTKSQRPLPQLLVVGQHLFFVCQIREKSEAGHERLV